jgi:hypothetical protein
MLTTHALSMGKAQYSLRAYRPVLRDGETFGTGETQAEHDGQADVADRWVSIHTPCIRHAGYAGFYDCLSIAFNTSSPEDD